MAARKAQRTLTGQPPYRPIEVVLGHRQDGTKGVSITGGRYDARSICFTQDEAAKLVALRDDLNEAVTYLTWDDDNDQEA